MKTRTGQKSKTGFAQETPHQPKAVEMLFKTSHAALLIFSTIFPTGVLAKTCSPEDKPFWISAKADEVSVCWETEETRLASLRFLRSSYELRFGGGTQLNYCLVNETLLSDLISRDTLTFHSGSPEVGEILLCHINKIDITTLQALLKLNPPLYLRNHTSSDIVTNALGEPDEAKKLKKIQALLAAGAIVDARNRHGGTALHEAAHQLSSQKVIMTLLEAGYSASAKDNFGWTPIHTLSSRVGHPLENLDELTLLLGSDELVNGLTDDGETPLHLAVKRIRTSDMISALLNAGADGTIRNIYGQTPFEAAVARGLSEKEQPEVYWLLHNSRFRQ